MVCYLFYFDFCICDHLHELRATHTSVADAIIYLFAFVDLAKLIRMGFSDAMDFYGNEYYVFFMMPIAGDDR